MKKNITLLAGLILGVMLCNATVFADDVKVVGEPKVRTTLKNAEGIIDWSEISKHSEQACSVIRSWSSQSVSGKVESTIEGEKSSRDFSSTEMKEIRELLQKVQPNPNFKSRAGDVNNTGRLIFSWSSGTVWSVRLSDFGDSALKDPTKPLLLGDSDLVRLKKIAG